MDNQILNCSGKNNGDWIPKINACYCYYQFYGDNCQYNIMDLTYFQVLYYIHLFFFDIFFLFLLIWGISVFIASLRNQNRSIFTTLSIFFVTIGTISRLVSSIGYFGYIIFSRRTFLIFYVNALGFWVIGCIFVVGMWTEMATASIKVEFKVSYIFVIIGVSIFALLEALICLYYITENILVIDSMNIVTAFIILFIVIIPLIFGNILLSRFSKVKKVVTKNKKRANLIKKTKMVMAMSIALGILLVLYTTYVVLDTLYLLRSNSHIAFQYTFRVMEIIGVSLTTILCSTTSIKNTFSNCLCPQKKDSVRTYTD